MTSQKHVVSKIFQHDHEGAEIMVFGTIDATYKNGSSDKDVEFVARIEIEKGTGTTKPKLRFFQGWVRSAAASMGGTRPGLR